jgi:2,4-diketo-3-deoxy-L-fuconate hydrolase
MKIVSFTTKDEAPRSGILVEGGNLVLDLSAAVKDSISRFDMDGAWYAQARSAEEKFHNGPEAEFETLRIEDVRLLAPVPRPGKIVCIGLNYRDHAEETKQPIPEKPILFSKFATSVAAPDQPVVLPPSSIKVDYEAELGVVIGRRAKGVSLEHAMDHVLGYTNFNDVSARDFQFADGQWVRGKSCDTFAPFGRYIATADEIPDPQALSIILRLNGITMQDSTTGQMIFGVRELIAFISETITLEPGDVIATGTPPGVGFARTPPVFLKAGDKMEVEIAGLGVLTNDVVGG